MTHQSPGEGWTIRSDSGSLTTTAVVCWWFKEDQEIPSFGGYSPAGNSAVPIKNNSLSWHKACWENSEKSLQNTYDWKLKGCWKHSDASLKTTCLQLSRHHSAVSDHPPSPQPPDDTVSTDVTLDMLMWCVWSVQMTCICGLRKCTMTTFPSGDWAVNFCYDSMSHCQFDHFLQSSLNLFF